VKKWLVNFLIKIQNWFVLKWLLNTKKGDVLLTKHTNVLADELGVERHEMESVLTPEIKTGVKKALQPALDEVDMDDVGRQMLRLEIKLGRKPTFAEVVQNLGPDMFAQLSKSIPVVNAAKGKPVDDKKKLSDGN